VIRPAVEADIPALVAMGGRFIATVYAGRLGDSADARADLMGKLIAHEDATLLVKVKGGVIVGMIGAVVYTQPISGDRIGGEMFWWVEPEHRGQGMRLLACAEAWAKAKGAVCFQSIAPSDRTSRLYARLGYVLLETVYQKGL
jgi:GNAT superfamily N-acetyltransferase